MILAGLYVLGCSGGSDSKAPTDPVEPSPANIVIVGKPVFQGAGNSYLTMSLHLQNLGGSGVYQVEVWSWGSGPQAVDVLSTRTEPVEVAAGYEETPSWQVFSPVTGTPIKKVLVSRDQGSAAYHMSWRCDYDFGAPVNCGSGSGT